MGACASQMQNLDDYNIFVVGQREAGLEAKSWKTLTKWKPNLKIKSMTLGHDHKIFTTNDGKLICDGNNNWGQCGVETLGADLKLVEIQFFKNQNIKIKKLFSSPCSNHTLWQTQNNQIYVSGWNKRNQCGVPDIEKIFIPIPELIQNIPPISHAVTGRYHTLLLMDPDLRCQNTAKIISFWTRSFKNEIPNEIIMTISGLYIINGNVYSTNDAELQHQPDTMMTKMGLHKSLGQNGDGANELMGDGFHPIPFFKDKCIKKIAAGREFSIFVDQDDNLWCCGDNRHRQFGIGYGDYKELRHPVLNAYFMNNRIEINDIVCGRDHAIVLDMNGLCYSWGQNQDGQCGVGVTIEIGGQVETPTRLKLPENEKIIEIKAGGQHSYVRSKENNHFLFGNNLYNQVTLTKMNLGTMWIGIGTPFCINDKFKELTGGDKNIKEIHMGYRVTWILTQ